MLNSLLDSRGANVRFFLAFCILALPVTLTRAQEKPYFVTYSQDLEEPGNLEVETKSALADPEGGNRFGAMVLEFEYGVRAWWTSELYLDGQTTAHESTLFTGYRLENRFRPLMREHVVNPRPLRRIREHHRRRQKSPRDRRARRRVRSDRPQPRIQPGTQARGRIETDPLLEPQGLEHLGKLHRGEESRAIRPGNSATRWERRGRCARPGRAVCARFAWRS